MEKELIIVILVISVICNLALLYNRYHIRHRYIKLLKTKQGEISEKNIALQNLISENDKFIIDKNVLQKEKEWLLKELHHRIKNNLQLVISLLNVQSEFLHNTTALNAIKESRERMEAIAIIHKKLYNADSNTTEVNMRSYIAELVDTIKDCFPNRKDISLELDIADISLDISQSVPLGLILNEAITNAIKYAYQKSKRISILVSLQHINDEELQLKISDNGKGLPDEIDTLQPKTLGIQLMKLFAEQLDGDLIFINANGLTILLNFKTTDYKNGFSSRLTA